MPSENLPFTPSSILFHPHQKPFSRAFQGFGATSAMFWFERLVVEVPGTAPGSEWFITTAIYRHSRFENRHP